MIMRIVIINGPNMNLLGVREPQLYGNVSFDDYLAGLKADFAQVDIVYLQSNHEGDLIDWLQKEGFRSDGIVLNAAGYTHSSVAIRDAVAAIPAPVVEVHLTDTDKREPFRRISYLTDVCRKTIRGKGLQGYREAVEWLMQNF